MLKSSLLTLVLIASHLLTTNPLLCSGTAVREDDATISIERLMPVVEQLARGIKPNRIDYKYVSLGMKLKELAEKDDIFNALYWAVAEDNCAFAKWLVECCEFEVAKKDARGMTAVHQAIYYGHFGVLTCLSDFKLCGRALGANIMVNKQCCTVLDFAIRHKNFDIAAHLYNKTGMPSRLLDCARSEIRICGEEYMSPTQADLERIKMLCESTPTPDFTYSYCAD